MRLPAKLTKLLVPATFLLLPLVALAESIPLQNPLGGTDTNPAGTTDFLEIFARVISGLYFVTGTITLVFVVLGGYTILAAAGNSERYVKGKKMVVYAILGMLLTVGSYTVLATTLNVLTGGSLTKGGSGSGLLPFSSASGLFDPLNFIKNGALTGGAFIFYGARILGTLMQGLGAFTLAMFVLAGITWMTAGGNEERVARAKKTFSYAVVGLAIVLTSYALISFIYVPFYRLVAG